MRVINRTAITIVGAKPYVNWTLQKEADVNKGTLTVARAKTYGSAFRYRSASWRKIFRNG